MTPFTERLPREVLEVFDLYRTCEFTTLAKDGTPVTWPTFPMYDGEAGAFLFSTSVGLPYKAHNVRRNPKVAMLFSDPTGSGLADSPTVLVQGLATCPDELATDIAPLEEYARRAFERQPSSRHYGRDPFSRRLMGWYFLRLLIQVEPRRVTWWPDGDLSCEPLEVEHVA